MNTKFDHFKSTLDVVSKEVKPIKPVTSKN